MATPTAATAAVVIDTSVWVSALLSMDVNHAAANTWVRNHISNGGRLVAPVLLVVETGASVRRITGSSAAVRTAVNQLYRYPLMRLIPMDQQLVDEATELVLNYALKGADGFYAAVANRLGLPLVSFDAEQLARPAAIIQTIRP